MSFYKFWQRRNERESSSGEVSTVDIFYLATYMSAIAAAGIPRRQIFELASKLPCASSQYFKKVHLMVDGLGYDYGVACRLVGESVTVGAMKSLMLRIAGALNSGEMGADFLAGEAQIQGEAYENEYERDVEAMRKWTDAYSALTVSVTLVIIINLISSMIYEAGDRATIAITVLALLIGLAGAWIISRAAPKEMERLPASGGTEEHKLSRKLLKILAPSALVICLGLALLKVNLGWLFVASGLLLFPVGLINSLGDGKAARKEQEIGSLLRTMGGMATSLGTTLAEAVNRIDLRSFAALRPDVERLRLRLLGFVSFDLSWEKFIDEAGSALIGQSGGIFHDSVAMGGDPEREGFLCSLFASKVSMLRAKRGTVSSTFVWLSFVMHLVVMALMVFIMEIVAGFQAVLQEQALGIGADLPLPIFSFGSKSTEFLYTMTKATMFLLTVTPALALTACKRGNRNSFFFYFGMLLVISGLALLGVPRLARPMFQGAMR